MNTLKMGKKDHLRNKSEYEVYEDDLNNYNNRSRSKLQQWNLIQSRLMTNSPKHHSKNINLPLITKTNADHNPPMQTPTISSKVVKQVTLAGTNHANGANGLQNSPTAPKSSRTTASKDKQQNTNSYCHKIKMQFQATDYNNKTTEELHKDLKSMRQMLIQLNDLVTSKLNKYQLATFTPKGMAVPTQPDKQQQLLYAKIETNSRIIEALEKEIKEIQQRDKQLEEKDYLIQLEQSVNLIMQDMREKRKEKIQEGVAVEKLDSRLVEIRDASLDDQFKMVKVIKHNILYYFKKFNENNAIIAELDKNHKDLIEKDEKLLRKYNQLTKIAQQKNMLVKSNKNYIENKKTQDELIAKVDQGRKKIQVFKRANLTQCQKISRQIEKMKKQLIANDNRSQQAESSNLFLGKTIQDLIQKNQIGKKVLNSISYKFAQVLLKDSAKDSARNTNKQSSEGVSDLKADTLDKSKLFLKPKLKVAKQKQSLNNSLQASARYRTLDIEQTEQKANDKNIQTINFQGNKSKQFRIKPSLHIKKRSENDASKIGDSIQMDNDHKANDSQIIYKPKRFQKILSLKKDKESA